MTTRHAIAPSAWGLSVAVVVGGVGGASTSGSNKAGGYGTGNGGTGEYVNANDSATGGGGGSSVSLGVTTLLQLLLCHRNYYYCLFSSYLRYRRCISLTALRGIIWSWLAVAVGACLAAFAAAALAAAEARPTEAVEPRGRRATPLISEAAVARRPRLARTAIPASTTALA